MLAIIFDRMINGIFILNSVNDCANCNTVSFKVSKKYQRISSSFVLFLWYYLFCFRLFNLSFIFMLKMSVHVEPKQNSRILPHNDWSSDYKKKRRKKKKMPKKVSPPWAQFQMYLLRNVTNKLFIQNEKGNTVREIYVLVWYILVFANVLVAIFVAFYIHCHSSLQTRAENYKITLNVLHFVLCPASSLI